MNNSLPNMPIQGIRRGEHASLYLYGYPADPRSYATDDLDLGARFDWGPGADRLAAQLTAVVIIHAFDRDIREAVRLRHTAAELHVVRFPLDGFQMDVGDIRRLVLDSRRSLGRQRKAEAHQGFLFVT